MKIQNTFVATGILVAIFGVLFSFSVATTLGYAGEIAKSDLVISDVIQKRTVSSNFADVTVRVANRGESSSRKSWVGIYVGDTFRRSCVVPLLLPQQETSVSCRYYFSSTEKSSGSAATTFYVDDMEEIWESNENNNTKSVTLSTRNTSVSRILNYDAPAIVAPTYATTTTPTYTPVVTSTPTYVSNANTQSACAFCSSTQRATNIQSSYVRGGSYANSYHYDPSAPIYTVKTTDNHVACPYGTNRSCIKATTYAKSSDTGECRSFTTTCLPLTGNWVRVARCTDNSSSSYYGSSSTGTYFSKKYKGPFMRTNDEHFAVYNGEPAEGQLISVHRGETVEAEIALMEIDNTKRNFVYQNISNNFSLKTIDFPEDAVRCWTNRRSSGTTVYCRGQQPNTSIQYQLTARTAGSAPIFTRVQYDQDGNKIEREGVQNFDIR